MGIDKVEAKKLLGLQEVELDISRINRRLEKIEEEKSKLRQEKEELNAELEGLKEKLENLREEIKQVREEIRNREEQLERTEKKLTMVKKESEYKAALKEKAKLEDFILKTSYELEALEKELEELELELEKRLPQLEEKLSEIEENIEDLIYEEKTALRRLEELKKEREIKEKELSPATLSFYTSAKDRFDSLVLVPMEESACAGCGMMIPDVVYSKMIKEESIEQCPNCGRFIYYKLG